jgi:hypothetical protein
MARVEPEALADPERVFTTGSLAEALRVEALLTVNGVDYAVHVETFSTSLFGTPRNGAAFYVTTGQAAYCRAQLTAAGLGRGVLIEDPPT